MKEATWFNNFIGDHEFIPSKQAPMEIFCVNEGVVALTKEPNDHGRSRHILRKYQDDKHKVVEGGILVNMVSLEDNLADLLTKTLSKIKHLEHAKNVFMIYDISFSSLLIF